MRRIALGGLMVAVLVLGVGNLGALVGVASADQQPVTTYSSYPAPLPSGCANAPGALGDVRFDNGRGSVATDLNSLSLIAGDRLTMSWSGAIGSCASASGQPAVSVTLAAYQVAKAEFDPSVDQSLLPGWATCGGGGSPCAFADGRYSLNLVLPLSSATCRAQVDSVLGLPLAVVGPSGSFYTGVLRGDNKPTMLISSGWLFGENCNTGVSPITAGQGAAPPPPPAAAPITAAPPATATPAPSPSVGVAPSTATAPSNAVAPSTATAPSNAVAPSNAAAVQPSTAPTVTTASTAPGTEVAGIRAALPSALPATGRSVSGLAMVGFGLVVAGTAALMMTRKRRTNPPLSAQ